MSKLSWYWHRMQAMSPVELLLHGRRLLHRKTDARREFPVTDVLPASPSTFPKLPDAAGAPAVLRAALERDASEILAGRWQAFGHLNLKVETPPKWHCDYLAGRDLATTTSAFALDYRALPGGADIKLIWELSRWHQLVRLAMAAYVLGAQTAGATCLDWLEDWAKQNPPYQGWNWTSALEAGLRLIQFAWIEALLSGAPGAGQPGQDRLRALRARLLPAHVWFVWRHRSFGSSANNHLLGELAGLIVATARWPALTKWGPSLETLRAQLQREILAQFAEDGGNREQALEYHLFSWELCWQARLALASTGRPVGPEVCKRLAHAAGFLLEMSLDRQDWPYGDSDGGSVTPFCASSQSSWEEWRSWMAEQTTGATIRYWLGDPPAAQTHPTQVKTWLGGRYYLRSGMVVLKTTGWSLRWDLSPLGYRATAAHGHLDALHLSLWFRGQPIVIDPGTGAYYADPELRAWLSSRRAHNGPCPEGARPPVRRGPFLWSAPHAIPQLEMAEADAVGILNLLERQVRRRISCGEDGPRTWEVVDSCVAKDGTPAPFSVCWQFTPGSWVKRISARKFSVHRADVAVMIEVDQSWTAVELVELAAPVADAAPGPGLALPEPRRMEGLVSPAFRSVVRAPYLKLFARPPCPAPCVFRTTFQACGA